MEGAGSKRCCFGVTRAGSLRAMRMMRGAMAETRGKTQQQGAGRSTCAEAGHHEGKESMPAPPRQIWVRPARLLQKLA